MSLVALLVNPQIGRVYYDRIVRKPKNSLTWPCIEHTTHNVRTASWTEHSVGADQRCLNVEVVTLETNSTHLCCAQYRSRPGTRYMQRSHPPCLKAICCAVFLSCRFRRDSARRNSATSSFSAVFMGAISPTRFSVPLVPAVLAAVLILPTLVLWGAVRDREVPSLKFKSCRLVGPTCPVSSFDVKPFPFLLVFPSCVRCLHVVFVFRY